MCSSDLERMRIDHHGKIILPTGSPGIQFGSTDDPAASGGTDISSQTLDDYEEGTWTPVLNKGTAGALTATTITKGTYIKIGKLLFIAFYIYKGSGSHGGSSSATWVLSGLPFGIAHTANSAYQFVPGGYLGMNGIHYNFPDSLSWSGGAGGNRWQANNDGGNTLSLYGEAYQTNWSSGAIEMAGTGMLMIA